MIFSVTNTSLEFFPIEPLFCIIHCINGEIVEVPREVVVNGGWGGPTNYVYDEPKELSMPHKIEVVYISILERQAYRLESKINYGSLDIIKQKREETPAFVIGLGPYGIVSIWYYNSEKNSLIETYKAQEIDIPSALLNSCSSFSVKSICDHQESLNINLSNSSFFNKSIVSGMTKQYNLKYNILLSYDYSNKDEFTDSKNNKVISIRDICFDGSFDYTNSPILRENHISGIPKKIFIEWDSKSILFYTCIVFNYSLIAIFEKFYGAHPETRADLIIRIDAENKKYELALYRQGLKEPVIIPESAYEMIVFKNKFEHYRSENYNQPRGGWIW